MFQRRGTNSKIIGRLTGNRTNSFLYLMPTMTHFRQYGQEVVYSSPRSVQLDAGQKMVR